MNYEEAREKIRNHTGPALNLKGSILRGSKLDKLPLELAKLKRLESLHLSHNNLRTLPDWFCRLKNLHTLNLRGNGLRTLPDWFSQLNNLHTLDLSSNSLRTLPDWFGELQNLQALNLRNNILITLPEWFRQLQNLHTLNLSSNSLSTLPDWFGQLQKLQALDLSSNSLSTLPDWFGQLQKLQTLDLSSNSLSTLPDWFGELQNLHTLNLSSNSLNTLPEGIGQLQILQTLNLRNNNLITLPEGFSQQTNLQMLDISANPIDIPVAIFGVGKFNKPERIQTLFTYLQSRHQDPHPKATFQIPEELRTAFKQYLLYFKDFLDSFEGVTVGLEVASTEDGLEIILEDATEQDLEQINHYLARYLSLIKENASQLTADGVDELEVIRLRNQVRNLQTELDFAKYKVKELKGQRRHLKKTIHLLASGKQTIKLDPYIHVDVDAKAHAEARATAVLKTELPALRNDFAKLLEALEEKAPTQTKEIAQAEQLQKELDALPTTATKEEIQKTGLIPRFGRFLKKTKSALGHYDEGKKLLQDILTRAQPIADAIGETLPKLL